ncbi:SET domain-containing protein 4 [Wickerhamomyces ciferrii]|uniref:SET domain-containing protein 4 n=1 Tax=Wickerhamomyces ciferrii (strain ATCC 14091 / BCRC 22168 / CBS 111 / JCM 3599 / NBRC 0793 / NRRL Y-1031 F-60-10) TaxID=1206466 RepID=K0K9M7_WICCF|nr:SET domain-containing protein 4 [Wickerhamomyces ciferrii]CCH41620.1 SET domain-containing protein 4 [Wickerhamomyces ciferrii]
MTRPNEEKLDNLLQWLLPSTTKTSISEKIQVKETQGSGRGIYATSDIKPNLPIITIDHSYLLNYTTIVAHIFSWGSRNKSLPDVYKNIKVPPAENEDHITSLYKEFTLEELGALSSFQIMSLFLELESSRGKESWWDPFIQMLPTINDFLTSPFLWQIQGKYELIEKLPKSTQKHSLKMFNRFESDFKAVKTLLETHNASKDIINHDKFVLYWMCINSRCLYMEIPQKKTTSDNFTMAPYVDFINHSTNDQCKLKIDRTGFHVITTSNYKENDELYLSYGPHSNEFLLCEYGFHLSNNEWNDLDITEEVIDLMNDDQIEYLKKVGYYGDYTINKQNVSFRTDVALAVLQERDDLTINRRLSALLNGISDGSFYKRRSKQILINILEKVKEDLERNLDLNSQDDPNLKVIEALSKERVELIDSYL